MKLRALLTSCICVTLAASGLAQGKSPAVGAKAPDFAVSYIDGSQAKLSDFNGKTVVVHFWATWCGPCVRELPSFDTLARERKDVVFLAVNCGESKADVSAFLKKKGLSLKACLDESGRISSDYGIEAIPMTLILDGSGKVSFSRVGSMSEAQWRAALSPAPDKKK